MAQSHVFVDSAWRLSFSLPTTRHTPCLLSTTPSKTNTAVNHACKIVSEQHLNSNPPKGQLFKLQDLNSHLNLKFFKAFLCRPSTCGQPNSYPYQSLKSLIILNSADFANASSTTELPHLPTGYPTADLDDAVIPAQHLTVIITRSDARGFLHTPFCRPSQETWIVRARGAMGEWCSVRAVEREADDSGRVEPMHAGEDNVDEAMSTAALVRDTRPNISYAQAIAHPSYEQPTRTALVVVWSGVSSTPTSRSPPLLSTSKYFKAE
ncbi:hypothetical protein C8F04DRAFT_1278639 [Mycena alexandri]|uniref:Uncharacterized protein n=1 Tax=Mycena alexandri TaxID=1745969 RepID=A0AAD6S0W6_9AGAR|nr:hypothetical protein C8F04DRAFT_1278639 [Mycena alexandri]